LFRKAASLKQRHVAHPKSISIFREAKQQIVLSGGRTISGKEE